MSRTSSASNEGSGRKRKRRSQQEWLSLPTYIDASATVSACIFGARRLPELKQLYQQTGNNWKAQEKASSDGSSHIQSGEGGVLQREQSLLSGGGKTSSRHLRRRTTSLKGRKRHRFPCVENQAGRPSDVAGKSQQGIELSSKPVKLSRRAKRNNRARLCESHYCWYDRQHDIPSYFEGDEDSAVDGDGALGTDDRSEEYVNKDSIIHTQPVTSNTKSLHWMTTHLWHAKRFHMDELWGWKIPMLHSNRGARAILRLTSSRLQNPPKAWIQDVTWMSQPLVLRARRLEALVASVRRICPCIVPERPNRNHVLCGSAVGEGVLYEIDQFPRGAIGPAMWRVVYLPRAQYQESQQRQGKDAEIDNPSKEKTSSCRDGEMWEYHVWTHPSIREDVRDALAVLATQGDSGLEEPSDLSGGMSRISLRGAHATSALRLLMPSSSSVNSLVPRHPPWQWDWDAVFANHEEENISHVPHGSIFGVQIQLENAENQNCQHSNAERTQEDSGYCHRVEEAIASWDPKSSEDLEASIFDFQLHNFVLDNSRVLLILQRPRNPDVAIANQAVCGWDILCSPDACTTIWHKLTTSNSVYNACAIGMVENTHLMLECQPPIPVFPRDYVDTKQGRRYWKGDDVEWQRVRKSWESGWGRVSVCKRHQGRETADVMESLSWEVLVQEEAEDLIIEDDSFDGDKKAKVVSNGTRQQDGDDDMVSVVRGSFGQPFCDALAGCSVLPYSADQKPLRRRRRRARRPTDLCFAAPLSRDEAFKFRERCRSLRHSLTLPAVLCCHITMVGPGKVLPGAKILSWVGSRAQEKEVGGCQKELIGIVTGGSFSNSRGRCHGVGFLGGARFLQDLEERATGSPFAAIGHCGLQEAGAYGGRKIVLLVTIDNGRRCDTEQSLATVSLLL